MPDRQLDPLRDLDLRQVVEVTLAQVEHALFAALDAGTSSDELRLLQGTRRAGFTCIALIDRTTQRSEEDQHGATAHRSLRRGWVVARRPSLAPTPWEAAYAHIRRGHVAYLDLNRAQKRALRDKDGQIFLDVLRHLLAARRTAGLRLDKWEAVEDAVQAIAAKIGHQIGDKRCREFGRRLIAAGVIRRNGSYRQPYLYAEGEGSFRVQRYALASQPLPTRQRTRAAVSRCGALHQACAGSANRRKPKQRPRWFQHPLFGDYFGRPPPGIDKKQAKKMRSLDEVQSRDLPAWARA